MNVKNYFIKDTKEFDKLEALVNKIFKINRTLPDQVFHKEYGNYLFQDFDWAYCEEFLLEIKELAKKTNDDFVLLAVLQPKPLSYYYKEFGYFNWVKLPLGLTYDEYMDILNLEPEESPADAIIHNTYIMVWVSPSMNWAIFGDKDNGVCVMAFKETFDITQKNTLLKNWRKVDEIVLDWIGFGYEDCMIPNEVALKVMMNYKY